MQVHNDADSSVYVAFNRRNDMANTTWALLFSDIYGSGSCSGSGGKQNAFFTRLPNEHELRVHLWAVRAMAIGET